MKGPRLGRYKVSLVGVELEAAPTAAGAPTAGRARRRWPGSRLFERLAVLLGRWWALDCRLRLASLGWVAILVLLIVRFS